MIYLRLTRFNGELLVDEAASSDLKEADDIIPQMLVRLKPGWTLVVEYEGRDEGEEGLTP